jgi:hypothetical protein
VFRVAYPADGPPQLTLGPTVTLPPGTGGETPRLALDPSGRFLGYSAVGGSSVVLIELTEGRVVFARWGLYGENPAPHHPATTGWWCDGETLGFAEGYSPAPPRTPFLRWGSLSASGGVSQGMGAVIPARSLPPAFAPAGRLALTAEPDSPEGEPTRLVLRNLVKIDTNAWPPQIAKAVGEAWPLEGTSGPLRAVALDRAGRWAAAGGAADTVWLFDAATGEVVLTLPVGGPVVGVHLDETGSALVARDAGGGVRVWEVPSGRELLAVRAPEEVTAVALSADGRLALGDRSGGVTVWTPGRADAPVRRRGPAYPVTSVALRPDGKEVAVCGADLLLRRWSLETDGPPFWFWGPTDPTVALAYAPDGAHLLQATRSASYLWDLRERKLKGSSSDGLGHPRDAAGLLADGASVWMAGGTVQQLGPLEVRVSRLPLGGLLGPLRIPPPGKVP